MLVPIDTQEKWLTPVDEEAFVAVRQAFSKRCPEKVPGALGPKERVYLYYAAKELFEGHGAMVELGAFLGASSQALMAGLTDNPRAVASSSKLHTFDIFYYDDSWGQQEITKLYNIVSGQPFLDKYRDNLAPFIDRVVVHQTDILKVSGFDEGIELLFVDVAKTEEILVHIANVFLPRLQVGGYCLNQDFFMVGLSYIKSFTEFFADYFEFFDPGCDATLVMRLVKKWDVSPDRMRDYIALSLEDKMSLHERLNTRFGGDRQQVLGESLKNMSAPFVTEKMINHGR